MSKNTKDILIIVGISLLVILVITSFLIYKRKGEEVLDVAGNGISVDETESQKNILTETEQEDIEKEPKEEEDLKTEEKTNNKEKEELENIKTNSTNKDTTTNNNEDSNNSSNDQSSTGGTTNTVKKLSEPQNVKWSESEVGLVTWSAVQYADGYNVNILKDGASIGGGASPDTSCDIKALISQFGEGTYTVKIKAQSSILPASDEVTTTYTAKQLDKPQNVKWSESEVGLVTWSAVQYADGYNVNILKDGASIGGGASPDTSCDIKALISQFGEGTYTVKIKAQSSILPASDEVTTTYTV